MPVFIPMAMPAASRSTGITITMPWTTGAPADVTVLDAATAWTVEPAAFHSKSRNSPFSGRKLVGRAVLTVVSGRVVHEL